MQDSRAIYRVFLVDGSSGGSGRLSKSELLVKNLDDVAGPSAMGDNDPYADQPLAVGSRSSDQPPAVSDQSPDQSPAVSSHSPDQLLGDYVSMGDYLELDDLAIPLSRTTSADSSCMTRSMTSEDFFDSDALLCELGEDNVEHDSRLKSNLREPANLKEVAMQSTTLGGSLDKESKSCTGQTSKTNPISESKPGDHCTRNTSNEASTSSSSSSSSEGSSKEERRDRVHRTKKRKLMKYLCFLAF